MQIKIPLGKFEILIQVRPVEARTRKQDFPEIVIDQAKKDSMLSEINLDDIRSRARAMRKVQNEA